MRYRVFLGLISQSSDADSMSGPELWSDSDDQEDNDLGEHEANQREVSSVRVFSLFVVLWQSVFKVSNVAVTVLLQFLSLFLCYLAKITDQESMKVLTDIYLPRHTT